MNGPACEKKTTKQELLWVVRSWKQYKSTEHCLSGVSKELGWIDFQDVCQLHSFQWENNSVCSQFSTCTYEFIRLV